MSSPPGPKPQKAVPPRPGADRIDESEYADLLGRADQGTPAEDDGRPAPIARRTVETVPQPRPASAPWAVHCFGYVAGLPDLDESQPFTGSLRFEMTRRFLGLPIPTEPVSSSAQIILSKVGSRRCVLSVIADAPEGTWRHHIRGLAVEIDGLDAGTIVFGAHEEASPLRSHSVVLGDPRSFTFDQQERLTVRNAIWRIEDEHLSGELTRQTIPGLPVDLLLESDAIRRLPESEAVFEIVRQLTGALRADSWGYLWKWNKPPTPLDGAAIALSPNMTLTMAEHLQSVTETILRACGAKPFRSGFESGTDVVDAVAYALVAMRRGLNGHDVAQVVLEAVNQYGERYDETRWRG